jgi:hypothetical protein
LIRLRLHWFSRPEDRFEAWLTQHHQELVLAGETTPSGPCPDEAFLKDLARKSKQIALSDPRVSHAANCRTCMRRLLALRPAYQSRRRRLVFTAAAVCCCLIVAVFVVLAHRGADTPHPVADMAAVPETLDLWNAGTLRNGQPIPLQSVTLPAAMVKVTIILPRYSEPGQYAVAVTRDQTGNDLLAQSSATANGNGDREEISVDLDLRKSKPGAYFLSTTHEQDQASYYYPLQIK